MPKLELVIGNYNLSSWSLRPWLAMKQFGIPFETIRIDLGGPHEKTPEVKALIRRHSPSGRVPALRVDGVTVWDSLAICEYLAETFPEKCLWPREDTARALARSVSAEMHAGFTDMRNRMWMNFRSSTPLADIPPAVAEDIERIRQIWGNCRERFGAGGPFLFGQFSIADAMYAPVVSRFTTYGIHVNAACRAYMDAMWALPAMQEWLGLARAE